MLPLKPIFFLIVDHESSIKFLKNEFKMSRSL